MKNRGINLSILLLIAALLAVILFSRLLPYYTPAVKLNEYEVVHKYDDTLRIAVIGDSWADFHGYYRCHIPAILHHLNDKPVQVYTSGISGYTSKEIYYSIFKNDSVRSAIEWGPDYCAVMAGINDADRKMGTRYYKESMRLIIDFLLKNHITPIIFEIPDFNIKYSFEVRRWRLKLKYFFSMFVHLTPIDCIDMYRNALFELLKEENWLNKIVYIRTSKWNPDGYMDDRNIYDESQMHLNEKGYEVLDTCIAYSIQESIES